MIKRLLVIAGITLFCAAMVRAFVFEGVWVASGSMEPTLPLGNHYFVNKVVYRVHPPLRGDIIVFQSPVDASRGLIKRVIATPGDRIEIRSKKVFINGSALEEPYAVYKRPNERLMGDNIATLTVPENGYFVLGDNRDESEDSSVWKNADTGERLYFISRKQIQGRLVIL